MLVSVLVKPGSKKGPHVEVAPFGSDVESAGLIVYLREKAHDGEANLALIKLLADYYNVAKSCIAIRRGQKSHRKVVEILM